MRRFRLAAACALGMAATSSTAATIGFEGILTPPTTLSLQTSIVSGGFSFAATGAGAGSRVGVYNNANVCTAPGCTVNGTASFLIYDAATTYPMSATMTALGGSRFALAGFDFAPLFAASVASGTSLSVTGQTAGGGSVAQSFLFQNGGSFVAATLGAGFGNLTSVTFSSDSFYAALDNIEVSAAVPLPAGAVLLGSALALGGLATRKRRR
ncbi:hypothetical protein [Mangrovicoccus sp. HB161399]|uniref:hypothetical protein n=1 Tax=Mangrovicoccus sp. HB161399 TaxID=2720392 RepID=UPI0015525E5F|nr:hypothetical protein [Mangrovicoccus sp. HB161399]